MERDGYLRSLKFREDFTPDVESFPYTIPAVRDIEQIQFDPAVTFFVGENASGKSTVLEATAAVAELNPEGGSRHLQFEERPALSVLPEQIRPVWNPGREEDSYFLRAESFFNVATRLENLPGQSMEPYGGRSPHEQSHGESFLNLVQNRFGSNGLYLMDEPEAALSPKGQLGLLARIDELVDRDSQFIIATHSPILMAYPDATIYLFSERGIETVEYEETEHYELYRNFLEKPERYFQHLFD